MSQTGRTISPSDPEYDEARKGWNDVYQSHPTEIIFCCNADEVASALKRCTEQQLPFRVRSGGHSLEGYSALNDGAVIDLSGMNSLVLNDDTTEVTLGPGARLGDVYSDLFANGVTVPGGTCPRVAVGGLVLGGGYGYLSRTYGMLAQRALSFEIVAADGRILTASKDEHADLFWACRGGGGGIFGIMTAVTLKTVPISDVATCRLVWSWDHFAEVFDAYQRWLPTSDSRLNTLLFLPAQHYGKIALSVLCTTTTTEELEPLLQSLLDVVPAPRETKYAVIPYIERVGNEDGLIEPQVYTRTRFGALQPYFRQPLDAAGIEALRRMHAEATGNTITIVCGAGSQVFTKMAENDPVSFPHLDALMSFDIRIDWSDPDLDHVYFDWLSAIDQELALYRSGTYLNYNDFNIDDALYPRYLDSFARLVAIKHRYDPDNTFQFPASIPPSLTEDEAERMQLPDKVIKELREYGRLT
ncbi:MULTISPECIES: FAD-binding oxidoreductase [unclassified Mycobacterium]|uniref:FAD-binding oxidoreductase n=1 Tax=unclassified Mycobacterium TaxID=2642494 RepID=UPI00089D66D1|nr:MULTISPECIES: FAD-binding oxidoreductase [unclassified Mycobacterium]SEA61040.1 FAD/FMN-containing dehydrogenase [Mycobacterium sp. 283mftsu]